LATLILKDVTLCILRVSAKQKKKIFIYKIIIIFEIIKELIKLKNNKNTNKESVGFLFGKQ
jgi:hypothetical protein